MLSYFFLFLFRLKQRGELADMTTLCDAVEKDWSGAHRLESQLKESVHSALGQLIKLRRVYYTGKGYFLVTPDSANGGNGPMKGLGTRFNKLR